MSKTPATLCGFDPTQEYFAGITSDGRVKIWNVSARKLQHSFVNSSHLQTPYTAFRWAPASFPEGPFIGLGTQSGTLIRYNFRKGITDHEWKTGETAAIYDLCFSESGSVYICGDFKSVIQVDFNTGKEIRKFKADNQFVSKLAITHDESKLISAGNSFVKVWDLSSGKLIAKFSGHTSMVNSLHVAYEDKFLFTSEMLNRSVSLWNLKNPENQVEQTFTGHDNSKSLTTYSTAQTLIGKKRRKRRIHQDGEMEDVEVPWSIDVLSVQEKRLNIWQFYGQKQSQPLQPGAQVLMPKQDTEADGISFLHAEFSGPGQVLLARGSLIRPRFEKLIYRDKGEFIKRIQLEDVVGGSFLAAEEVSDSFEKAPNANINVLDSTSINSFNAPKVFAEDSNQVSLEEKLEQLEIARNKTKAPAAFVDRTGPMPMSAPQADSVHVMLLQALQSGDDQIIDSCLSITEVPVIQKTLQRLPNLYVVPLMNNIIYKFHLNPARAPELVPWIQNLVIVNTSYLMSLPDLGGTALSDLHRTIDARLTNFDKLLKLSGRLDLLLTQVAYRETKAEAKQAPVTKTSIDEILDEGEESSSENDDENMADVEEDSE